MCGIVGYIGHRESVPILMDGLSRLSYRGYDSSGIATLDQENAIQIRKAKGKLAELQRVVNEEPLTGHIGIGHTRWATHGEPSQKNAHPHTDTCGKIAVVHNGIIENYEEIKHELSKHGIHMCSQTDTEVIAHLLNNLYEGNMLETLIQLFPLLQGSYALCIISEFEPGKLFCMRKDSPLVVSFQNGEGYVASDVPAILPHTQDVCFLRDQQIAVLSRSGLTVYDQSGTSVPLSFCHIDWTQNVAEKGGYTHFMLKEIHEQPEAIKRTLQNQKHQLLENRFPLSNAFAEKLRKITIVACGSAYHAGVYGKYVIEKLTRIPVETAIASEYRYRDPVIVEGELVIAVSQSGETADTLAALRIAKNKGASVLSVCNVVGSSVVRETGEEHTLYTNAGPEIAVASTKGYMTQIVTLVCFAAALRRRCKILPGTEVENLLENLMVLSDYAEKVFAIEPKVRNAASLLCQKKHIFFIGRGLDYALSLEAALKLKEISYLYGEACAAGELKHGPLALIEKDTLVVAALTQKELLTKSLSNLKEASARGAYILAVTTSTMSENVKPYVDEVLCIPDTDSFLVPLLAAIPLQLFAYYVAVERGCDPDQPRNLAKSVTVE